MTRHLIPAICVLLTACGEGTVTSMTPDCVPHLDAVGASAVTIEIEQSVELTVRWSKACAVPRPMAVQFTLTDAPAGTWLSATQAMSGDDGIARVAIRAGTVPGVALVSARGNGLGVDFTVTVSPKSGAGGGSGATGGGTGGAAGGGTGGAAGGGTGGAAGGGTGGAAGGGTGGAAGGGTGGAAGGGTGGATGGGTGGGSVAGDSAVVVSHTLPASMSCGASASATVTLRNNGTTTWAIATHQLAYAGDLGNLFLPFGAAPRVELAAAVAPGATVTIPVDLHAPLLGGSWEARFRMTTATTAFGGAASRSITVSCAPVTTCSFPQGVAEAAFTNHADLSATVATIVNTTMETLSGCPRGSDCYIGDRYTDQTWFAAVSASLRAQGLCAGQHELGYTDEIAVSMTGCGGLWYGYHVFNYGGLKVVWNNGAQRGSWSITPSLCP